MIKRHYNGVRVEGKKLWEKPKLLLLFRGRPEESVLEYCKKPLPPREIGSCIDPESYNGLKNTHIS